MGNWTEPLGLVSLAVEAVLFALAATLFRREVPYRQLSAGLASAWPGRSSSEPAPRSD